MKSKRILAIANLINKDDKLIDVGCDHGYLGIYLKKNKLVNDLLLTDLRESALNNAIENIKKAKLDINTFLTDGLNNIDLNKYNCISISGMGTSLIIKILSALKDNSSITKLIIQSNNDLDILRKEISNLGFYLDDEVTIYENGIYYIICKFIKGNKKLDQELIEFGLKKLDKKPYYNYLINYWQEILKKVPKKNETLINELNNKIEKLNKLLKECR